MKATVVGLVTPHVLRVIDLAKQAETGVNVDWHLRDAVTKTVEDLSQQFNAADLLAAYENGLETAARDGQARTTYFRALQSAAASAVAARKLKERD